MSGIGYDVHTAEMDAAVTAMKDVQKEIETHLANLDTARHAVESFDYMQGTPAEAASVLMMKKTTCQVLERRLHSLRIRLCDCQIEALRTAENFFRDRLRDAAQKQIELLPKAVSSVRELFDRPATKLNDFEAEALAKRVNFIADLAQIESSSRGQIVEIQRDVFHVGEERRALLHAQPAAAA